MTCSAWSQHDVHAGFDNYVCSPTVAVPGRAEKYEPAGTQKWKLATKTMHSEPENLESAARKVWM